MSMQDIAAAMQRVEGVLRRRPQAGVHDDAPATARWQGGTRSVASHANGTQVTTDMPTELGGSGDQVSPGWLFRAGLASCTATVVAMRAAAAGIELSMLEVRAGSRSDTRGLLNMEDQGGELVCAGPSDIQMHVRVSAPGISEERLRALVEESRRCSPIFVAVRDAMQVSVRTEVEVA
jgi:uncharacterized OsmC-like protein